MRDALFIVAVAFFGFSRLVSDPDISRAADAVFMVSGAILLAMFGAGLLAAAIHRLARRIKRDLGE